MQTVGVDRLQPVGPACMLRKDAMQPPSPGPSDPAAETRRTSTDAAAGGNPAHPFGGYRHADANHGQPSGGPPPETPTPNPRRNVLIGASAAALTTLLAVPIIVWAAASRSDDLTQSFAAASNGSRGSETTAAHNPQKQLVASPLDQPTGTDYGPEGPLINPSDLPTLTDPGAAGGTADMPPGSAPASAPPYEQADSGAPPELRASAPDPGLAPTQPPAAPPPAAAPPPPAAAASPAPPPPAAAPPPPATTSPAPRMTITQSPWPRSRYYVAQHSSGPPVVSGSLIWYNRSVGVSGTMQSGSSCTAVLFTGYSSTGQQLARYQTAYQCGSTAISHILDASTVRGGIRKVYIDLYVGGTRVGRGIYLRP
jgi:hypothetical protein